MRLPIEEILDEVVGRLSASPNLVVIAPPGAGKTTRIPQVIADRVTKGQVLVLEPRRLAARLAATRVAKERNVRIGDEVGYQVRFDDRTSALTKIAFLTEGILTRRIQSDPLLEGAGCVILDEFHERSIHADLAIALLREIQVTVRPELHIVVMSATLEAAPLERFLDCGVLRSEGRAHPVDVRYLERPDERPLASRAAAGARRALRETEGDVLVFLPGAGEIRRAKDELASVESADVHMLYGELSPDLQDRAIEPGARKKVILSTNIAESSLTIEGVRCVVDGGFAKVARHDPRRGIDRLELVKIGKRSADQRTGRAGRLGPGVAYRLWTEKEHQTLPLDQEPEIARIDLSPAILDVIRWSKGDPSKFGWFEAPPASSMARAVGLLEMIGAIHEDRGLTPLGELLAQFPLHPRIAAILVAAHRSGYQDDGASIAALASESRSRHGSDARVVKGCDLQHELEGYLPEHVRQVEKRLKDLGRRILGAPPKPSSSRDEALRRAVLAGFFDRVGRVRSGEVVLVGGGSAHLSKESVVQSAELLVAVEIGSGGHRGRGTAAYVQTATQIEEEWLPIEERTSARWDAERSRAEVVIVRAYRDLVLGERPGRQADRQVLSMVLAEAVRKEIDRALPMTEELLGFLHRYRFLKREVPEIEAPDLGDDPRLSIVDDVCVGKKSFAELKEIDIESILSAQLPREVQASLRKDAPEAIAVPSGRHARLRYEVDGPPVLSIRLQEVFGLYETPRVAKGRVPIKMELLAPNMRPVQVTQDLASFWANTYDEVRRELARRYPKHQWPEDPRDGVPSARTRRRQSK